MSRPLIVGGYVSSIQAELPYASSAGPRYDLDEIARCLGGELGRVDALWHRRIRQSERYLKLDLTAAMYALRQCVYHNVVLSTSEKAGLPLAVLLWLARRQVPHVMIAHKLSSGRKTELLRVSGLARRFASVICLCRAQASYANEQLGLPAARVHMVYDKVDQRFFHPMPAQVGNYILAVGQEQRDYETLLSAIEGTGIRVVLVASSPWSSSRARIAARADVTVLSRLAYTELRDLYAQARLVVVPLHDVDYAAGVNAVLEAMAMAKPLIVSRTRGIVDYLDHDMTAICVAPGRADEMRAAILSTWDRPNELARLGANARHCVETRMNMDVYVEQVARIVQQAAA